ncbi:uncharacterized protein STEHIDRAFT_50297 [Stereum hirsutum FP-91666 SS1]|uniref:uncharacterized protein n=1 Tax=Stereum hirsutum (strain FP-91666) TaxID=721885 RepID=UPI000440C89D|nr:uncharacterized protein STEHIDRAFT_50297 [Stereum hirsutum FP-91666 SS1]EIM90184.1 hypothetical protein STEHIDRAFT_50297 [Stereum hirsutum FP-91666 SS1]
MSTIPPWLRDNFSLWPTFLNEVEQVVLLRAALRKLDDNESRTMRRRRRDYLAAHQETAPRLPSLGTPITKVFLPDEYYQFEEGHFDGVIKRYREIHVSSWGVNQPEPPLVSVLDRLHGLHPSGSATQTHVLHLASDGEILPHIDNTEASGSWIMGVSLGDERILRVAPDEKYTATEPFEIALPSGSVYLQKDSVRYRSKHSILPATNRNQDGTNTQRLSVMIRVSYGVYHY